ncbi:hypothetical protein ACFXC8_13270 [Streptomyces sp. NPDC059441]|uniref:hypothetical protein n=1 Tax=Streptomyces sp. NPDC059441 TaxID=3346829 RepID=UPI00369C727D
MELTFELGTRDGAPTKLHPVYDARQEAYSLQLWENGQLSDEHGPFPYAGDVVETADDFLARRGIRRLTGAERTDLYARLLTATGDLFYARCVLMLAEPQDQAAMLMHDEIQKLMARLPEDKWGVVAFRIEDGSTDGQLYPDREAAEAAQDDPEAYTTVVLPADPESWTVDRCLEHLDFMTHLRHGCMVLGVPVCWHAPLPTPQV